MKALLFLLACWAAQMQAQVTSWAISDSIAAQLDALGYDSLIHVTENAWKIVDGDTSVYSIVYQTPGGGYMGISNSAKPSWLRVGDTNIKKCWTFIEIDSWLSGNCSGYTGVSFTDALGTTSATITIDGDTWQGRAYTSQFSGAANLQIQAFGRALLNFIFDENFSTYVD